MKQKEKRKCMVRIQLTVEKNINKEKREFESSVKHTQDYCKK
jgi:hypothetical protein